MSMRTKNDDLCFVLDEFFKGKNVSSKLKVTTCGDSRKL